MMTPWEHLRTGEKIEGKTGHELQPFLTGRARFSKDHHQRPGQWLTLQGHNGVLSSTPIHYRLLGTGDRIHTIIRALQDQVLCGLSSSFFTTGHSDTAWQKRRRVTTLKGILEVGHTLRLYLATGDQLCHPLVPWVHPLQGGTRSGVGGVLAQSSGDQSYPSCLVADKWA